MLYNDSWDLYRMMEEELGKSRVVVFYNTLTAFNVFYIRTSSHQRQH